MTQATYKANEWRRREASLAGQRLRRHRTDQGLSQFELGVKAGVHPQLISDTERGRRFPSDITRSKLAHALGLDPADLLPSIEEYQGMLAEGIVPRVGIEYFIQWLDDLRERMQGPPRNERNRRTA